ncbi:unnamed protein product [Brachionus calyciflorus]|uniref:Protein kinase domain-containing protein n=1 Tax=Brachionus calyciflorus TaxID=104777 RepID=A0A813SQV1_9BILA|nr:unnamed protein product [Brachionus calyciflorus]
MKKSTINNSSSSEHSKFIGKCYQLSKHQVVIEDVIAEGGFSIVFLVRSNQNGKKYALKRMYVNNEHDLEACRLEIKIIKTFSESNKNVLKYIDSSIQRQTNEIYEILLLTKYCKLGGLVQLMNDRLSQNSRFQEVEILKIFCDTCEALADLHTSSIIHRDLKVENILIDQESGIKNPTFNQLTFVLCDFGSATKNIFDKKQHSSSHSIQLIADEIQKYTTLSYRSPEMVDLYSNKLITTKSDIWALGVFLYKLCYFQMPFGESQLAIQEGRYFIPDSKATFYSKQLNQLINYMLDPDPNKRPDIFQVSYLAFYLSQKQCPVKNIHNSEIPNFSAIQAPLTESEWKKSTNHQIKKPLSTPIYDSNPSTTVNPRERPKANLNPNQILQLSNQNIVKAKPVSVAQKINVSIKPVASQSTEKITPFSGQVSTNVQEQLGFDDDFGSNFTPSAPVIQTDNKPLEQTPVNDMKKSHRRSASHSSSLFSQFVPSSPLVQHSQSAVQPQSRLTPTQLSQQINYQIQQQKLQQQYQIQAQQNITPLSVQTLNRLYTHSRSASASPNIVGLANLNLNHTNAQSIQEEEKKVSNNPFDDNDLFGQEFDKIRHESSSTNGIQEKKINNDNGTPCKKTKKNTIVKYSTIDDNDEDMSFDPFRKAPLPLFNANVSSSSSSSSSTRSSPKSNSSQQQVTISAQSAFQPYKKHPDPFVSAPFEPPTNRKISLSSTSTSSSVTPTALTITNISKSNNLESLNELDSKANDEIIQVIQMKDKLVPKTPLSQKNKQKNSANPFVDAPFTVKKTKVITRKKLSELTQITNDINRTPTNENNKPVGQNDLTSQIESETVNTNTGGISNMSFDDF